MNKNDLKLVQMAIGYAEDVIRRICLTNGMETYELGRNGYQNLESTFYAMNSCWLDIQRELEGGSNNAE